MEGMRKGQVFVIGALLFSGLIILVFLSFGNIIQTSPEPVFRNYFEDNLEKQSHVFNDALAENSSSEYVKRKLYSHNRFSLLRSRSKGIDYETINFFILPEKGEAVFINYRQTSTDVNILIGNNWHNFTESSKQFREIEFSKRNPDIRLIVENPSIDRKFTSYTPRFFAWMRMDSQNEEWNNQILR